MFEPEAGQSVTRRGPRQWEPCCGLRPTPSRRKRALPALTPGSLTPVCHLCAPDVAREAEAQAFAEERGLRWDGGAEGTT